MLLGCCHCGGEESVPSFAVPSVNTPSLLNPSESATSIFGNVPGFCGACYNFPGRWKVGTKGDWFVWNPNYWNGQVDDCPIVPTYVYHTLYNHPVGGVYDGMTLGAAQTLNFWQTLGTPCAMWRSDTKAVELSSNPCGNSPPLYTPCGPNTYNIPLVELVAFNVGGVLSPTSTQFYLFYWWSECGKQLGYYWQWNVTRQTPPYSISCVRTFEGEMVGSAGYDILGMPYSLSTTDTSWGSIIVEPA